MGRALDIRGASGRREALEASPCLYGRGGISFLHSSPTQLACIVLWPCEASECHRTVPQAVEASDAWGYVIRMMTVLEAKTPASEGGVCISF